MADFTADQLNTRFRNEVVDQLGTGTIADADNLWKETEVYGYMSEAADKVAVDTEGLIQVLPGITLVPNQQSYLLPRYVEKIRIARLATANVFLEPTNIDDEAFMKWDDYGREIIGYGSMFTATGGPPRGYMLDYDTRRILLIPIPTVADTLILQAVCTLAVPLQTGMPLPFWNERDQRLMLHYMKYLAYSRQDVDTLDLKRSKEFEGQYNAMILERKMQVRRRRRTPGTVQSNY